jgi:hypothetical protein
VKWIDVVLSREARTSDLRHLALSDELLADPTATTITRVLAALNAEWGQGAWDDALDALARQSPGALLEALAPDAPLADRRALEAGIEARAMSLGAGEGGLALRINAPAGMDVAAGLDAATLRAFTELELFRDAGPAARLVARREALSGLRKLRLGAAEEATALAACALSGLRELDLRCDDLPATALARLEALGELRDLTLRGALTTALAAALGPLATLQALEVEAPAEERAWAALGALKSLASLRVRGRGAKLEAPSERCVRHLARLEGLTELDLSGCDVGDEGALAVAAIGSLVDLDLDDARLTPRGVRALASPAAPRGHLRRLRLRGHVGAEGLAAIGALEQLVDLNLDRCTGLEGASFAPLRALRRLRALDVCRLPVGDDGAEHIAALHTLELLGAAQAGIGPAGATAIGKLKRLVTLDLSHNPIGDHGATAIADLRVLAWLQLDTCDIGDGAAALSALDQLSTLQLQDNRIADTGLVGWSRLTRLQTLYLSNNRIGDQGAIELGELPSIRDLSLGGNRIGGAGALGLSRAAALRALVVSDNRIGDAGVVALARLRSLQSLSLSNCDVGNHVAEAGAAALASLPRLEQLYLARCVSPRAVAALASAGRLRVLWLESNGLCGADVEALGRLVSLRSLGLGGNPVDGEVIARLGVAFGEGCGRALLVWVSVLMAKRELSTGSRIEPTSVPNREPRRQLSQFHQRESQAPVADDLPRCESEYGRQVPWPTNSQSE